MTIREEMERMAQDVKEVVEALDRLLSGDANDYDEQVVKEWLGEDSDDLFYAFLDQLLDIEVHEMYSFATRDRYPEKIHLVHGTGGPGVRTVVDLNGRGEVRVSWGAERVRAWVDVPTLADHILELYEEVKNG